jgi:hypothetical protein
MQTCGKLNGINGGRTRTRTWDPLIKSPRARVDLARDFFKPDHKAHIARQSVTAGFQTVGARDSPHDDRGGAMTCGVPRWKRNVAQRGDALDLLTSLPDACAALAFFDPQHRGVLDKLALGNEGASPTGTLRHAIAARHQHARDLAAAGIKRWLDTYGLCEAHHLRVADCLKSVDLNGWRQTNIQATRSNRRHGSGRRVHRDCRGARSCAPERRTCRQHLEDCPRDRHVANEPLLAREQIARVHHCGEAARKPWRAASRRAGREGTAKQARQAPDPGRAGRGRHRSRRTRSGDLSDASR